MPIFIYCNVRVNTDDKSKINSATKYTVKGLKLMRKKWLQKEQSLKFIKVREYNDHLHKL
jgi:hypothetical protein